MFSVLRSIILMITQASTLKWKHSWFDSFIVFKAALTHDYTSIHAKRAGGKGIAGLTNSQISSLWDSGLRIYLPYSAILLYLLVIAYFGQNLGMCDPFCNNHYVFFISTLSFCRPVSLLVYLQRVPKFIDNFFHDEFPYAFTENC